MPTTRVTNRGLDFTFDARPDRVDFRDLVYRAPLRSLPPQYPSQSEIDKWLTEYTAAGLVLDQKAEGSCTGFGLAALVDYLLFRRAVAEDKPAEQRVSARMLYQMARVYDEWPGEDYDGSSCRGAMKGWHRHGVTTEKLWPYLEGKGKTRRPGKPKNGWRVDAASRPLGAYYRIDKNSINDLQAAIFEVGAIYCSADVHDGWFLATTRTLTEIPFPSKKAGGHAFALVGYTPSGFIVQNSWGPTWGYHGFGILTYEDWVKNGADAWAAVLGAPMSVAVPRTRVSLALNSESSGRAQWIWGKDRQGAGFTYKNPKVKPLDEEGARLFTIVLGNDGRPINHLIDVDNAADALTETAVTRPKEWFAKPENAKAPQRLAIYAHGGLNDEETSIARIRVMAPYFRENAIYPLFITWKTGFLESIEDIIQDAVGKMFSLPQDVAKGWLDDMSDDFAEGRDRAIEAACENLLVKPIWTQMKQNAEASAAADGGVGLLGGALRTLAAGLDSLEIHLVGHSAGSILLGHLLAQMQRRQLAAKSLSLYAPACTVEFAYDMYGAAVAKRVIAKKAIHLDVMSDERERADTVGPYGKSLLYLVSRALEREHKTPLLGMQSALDANAQTPDQWAADTQGLLADWRAFAGSDVAISVSDKSRARVLTGQSTIPLAHGSFDNDVKVVAETLERIRGGKLLTPVENLEGF